MIIRSDLTFSVSSPGRPPATGSVTAEGAHVTVETTDPVAVWDGALGSVSTGPAVLRVAADQLSEQGITVSVTGPAGRVATVGAGVRSPLGRVLTGSGRVSLGSPRAVAPLARARVRSWSRTHRALQGAGLAVAVVAAGLATWSRLRE